MNKIILYGIAFFLLASCAHIISQEYHEQAVRDVSFRKMLASPDAYFNRIFILGGIIAGTTNIKGGSEIEVVQTPVNRYGSIIDPDISEGRFLIISKKQLDPLIYKKGRYITLAGKLTGTRTGSLVDVDFKYPLFEAEELYLWREERNYRPYYYDYYYEPFYYPYSYNWYYPYWPGFYYRYPWRY
jgi:outer membrane lipoprotein